VEWERERPEGTDETGDRREGRVEMSYLPRSRTIGVGFGVCVAVVCLYLAGAGTVTAQSADIVVATDGSGDYTSIQNAVQSASDGDRIEVKPGTYNQPVFISKNITLVAPEGATIANTSAVESAAGMRLFDGARPHVSGFTLIDWRWGMTAFDTTGDWVVQNTTIKNSPSSGIAADGSTGDWGVKNVTIIGDPTADESEGIDADRANGSWEITNSTIRAVSEDGVSPDASSGDWSIRNTTINATRHSADLFETSGDWTITSSVLMSSSDDAVNAVNATGNWEIRNTTINGTDDSINAYETSGSWIITSSVLMASEDAVNAGNTTGNWEIRDTTINATEHSVNLFEASGNWTITSSVLMSSRDDRAAVNAFNATGNWEIRNTILTDGTGRAITAIDEPPQGNASYNYWGASDGPGGDFDGSGGSVVGNVIVTPYYIDSSLTTLSSEQGSQSSGLPTDPGEPRFGEVLAVIQAFNTNSEYANSGVIPRFGEVLAVIQAFNAG
jgi:hypothetical protein